MKLTDPDDLKPPHRDIHSLMAAFQRAWQAHNLTKEQK